MLKEREEMQGILLTPDVQKIVCKIFMPIGEIIYWSNTFFEIFGASRRAKCTHFFLSGPQKIFMLSCYVLRLVENLWFKIKKKNLQKIYNM